MKSQTHIQLPNPPNLVTGLFSKTEAAQLISQGVRHLHSSILGAHDPCVLTTEKLLQKKTGHYSWDLTSQSEELIILKSSERAELFEQICSKTEFGQRTQNRTSLRQILEELLTNAIFHAYKQTGNQDKYNRLQPANLSAEETISVGYAEQPSGLFLSVEDQGGNLTFESFSSCFKRCYSQSKSSIQLDQKHQGAGLGLYLIFELSTHVCVFVKPGHQTRFLVWIASSGQADPDTFSFNFFEES